MKQLLIVCGLVLIILWLLFYIFQRHLVYIPSSQLPNLNKHKINGLQTVSLHTSDGLKLLSWYKPALLNQPTLLFLHGNAGNIEDRLFLAKDFFLEGFGVLLLEYRGYGGNQGKPSELGFYTDARAGLNFLHKLGIKSDQIVLYGESLGTGVATQMATEDSFCALVLQSAYTSLPDLAHYHYPWIWMKPWDKFDSISKIGKIKTPLLSLHAKKDTIVPYALGLEVFQKAQSPKLMISFENMNHNDLWHAPKFAQQVNEFIKNHCHKDF